MERLIAVDPGTRELGWAIFEHRRLFNCGMLRSDHLAGMVREVKVFFAGSHYDRLVVEHPESYGMGAKVNPNKLMQLSVLAGVLIGSLDVSTWELPRPATWKGQVPKDVMRRRATAALNEEELEIVTARTSRFAASYRHNIWDAVEIGLWKTKRI